MRIRASSAAALIALVSVFGFACSSSASKSASAADPTAPVPPAKPKPPKDPRLGVRVLDAIVVAKSSAPSGSGGVGAYSGSGTYYMVFETHEGDATARYQLEVNRTQWFRFQEGARVRITLNNNILQDIRSID